VFHDPPPSPQSLLQYGLQCLQQGQADDARSAFHHALHLDPDNAAAHHMLGLMALQAGKLEEGVERLKRSIACDPTDPGAFNNLGNALRDLGRMDEALEAYQAAFALEPTWMEALNNRAVLYSRLGRFEEAVADYDGAIAQAPRIPQLHNNRAQALRALGRHGEALAGCAQALRLDPSYAEAHLNRGTTLSELGRDKEAFDAYQSCLTLNPRNAEAHFYSGTTLLMLGDLERGFERYEARTALRGPRQVAPAQDAFPQPIWRGKTPLEGKTILLHSEQGLGDTIQFCRYVDQVKALGATVVLHVEPTLKGLLSSLKGADQVVAQGEPLPQAELRAPFMSLAHAFRTTLQTAPAEVPYLHADPAKAAAWADRLGPKRRPRVGLVWSGGAPTGRADLQRRNAPLSLLAPLAGADVDFVSLQKGEAAERELKALTASGWNGPAMLDVASELNDFSDTAALVANLDLVIAVDTSVAHLAGALGKPVWILNRFDNCWRWMRGRSDSPWYPTARLYRQKTFGDWAPVMQAVAADLRGFSVES
jgi:tetratricopeptide (TPR) repeat protein